MKRSFLEQNSQMNQNMYKERVGILKAELESYPVPKSSGSELVKNYATTFGA